MSGTKSWMADAVVTPEEVLRPGTVVVDAEGCVVDVHPSASVSGTRFGPGITLVPGAVDLHGDALEKLAEPRPGTRMPFGVAARALDRRLAAAGVTTSFSALSFAGDELGLREPGASAQLAHALRSLPHPYVDHRIHLRVELSHASSVKAAVDVVAAGGAALLSVMDHTPGQGQFRTVEAYGAYLQRTYGAGAPERQACLDDKLSAGAAITGHAQLVAAAAAEAGVPLAWHDPDTAAVVQCAADAGAVIAEFPTTLEAARAARARALYVVMGAPNLLRGSSSSGNLSAVECLRSGLLDALVSDYYPEAIWPAVFRSGLPLLDGVRLVTQAPAMAAGLIDRGCIRPGLRADLVALHSDGTVARTIVAGRSVA